MDSKVERGYEVTREQQRAANVAARKAGFGWATDVRVNPEITEARVVAHTPYGYRKNTTGQYVPTSYRSNFGWKNTYYQNAETVVEIPA